MKHTLLVTAFTAALLFANRSEAQIPVVSKVVPKVTLGIKVGANFQDLSSVNFKQAYNAGFLGGAFLGLQKRSWGIQVEGIVKSAKFNLDGTGGFGIPSSFSINTIYLDVPLLLEYKLITRLWLQLGPQFSDLLSAKNNSNDVKSDFKTTDFSGVLGLEARLPLHFTVGARYLLGFANINSGTSGYTDSWKTRTIQLYIGFRFL